MFENAPGFANHRPHPAGMGGDQWLFEYPNGFTASVVQFPGSYGYEDGLYELAVMDDSGLRYDTDITNDVVGRIDSDEVLDYLGKIQSMDPNGRLPQAV